MPRFRFTLQAVLEHRTMQEREKQRAVAVLERERLGLEGEIRAAQEAIAREHAEARAAATGPLDLHALRRQGSAAQRHHGAARHAAIRLAGVYQRLEAARAELLQAAKRRKAIELLRDHRYEEWKRVLNRREAAAADELAVIAGNPGAEDQDLSGSKREGEQ